MKAVKPMGLQPTAIAAMRLSRIKAGNPNLHALSYNEDITCALCFLITNHPTSFWGHWILTVSNVRKKPQFSSTGLNSNPPPIVCFSS